MRKDILTLIISGILLLNTHLICADPLITGIYYDPEGVDTGFEWIELYNPTNESINLENYVLFKGNGDKENDWSELPLISGAIAPLSFYLIGESNVSTSDLTLKLALFNGPDALALRSIDGEVVDLVGYGNMAFSEYSLGDATIDVPSEKALVRKFTQDNGTYIFSSLNNNSQDWQAGLPSPRNSLYEYLTPLEQNTSVTLVIEKQPILVENVTLSDDQSSKTGTQWSLVGKKRISLVLSDESGALNETDIQISLVKDGVKRIMTLHQQPLNVLSDTNYSVLAEFTMQLTSDLAVGNYSLLITLDSQTLTSVMRTIEILPSIGMEVCDGLELTKQEKNKMFSGSCLIRNVGNVPANFGLNLTFDSDLFFEPYIKLNQTLVSLVDSVLRLDAGEQMNVEVYANISRLIRFGTYKGTLSVRAWSTS